MGKRRWFIGVLGFLGIFIGVRIYYINREIEYPQIMTWQIGEEVDLNKNYFYDISEQCEGYSVCVNEVQLLTCEEFMEKYGYGEEEIKALADYSSIFPDMVYDVSMTIRNKNKEKKETGINLYDYNIYAADYVLSIDSYLYELANAEKKTQSLMFSLQPESELVFHLPYSVAIYSPAAYVSEDILQTDKLYLLISMYPIQNQILINKGEET